MPGRNSQISRIYRILNLLEGAPQGLSILDLWKRINDRGEEIGKRTIYRDVEALEAAGFPLLQTEDVGDEAGRRWSLDRSNQFTKNVVLSAPELLALYLSREALTPLRETPFFRDIQSVFQKIEAKLGPAHREHLDELSSEIHFQPAPAWGLGVSPDVFETLRAACSERQCLRIEYSSVNSGDRRMRIVGPHYIYFSYSAIYLIAEDMETHTIKTFSIPRVHSAEMLEEAYEGAVSDPAGLFEHSFGIYRGTEPVSVKLEFAREVASFIKERRWHASQRVVSKQGGRIEVSLEVALTPEFTQWVLSFGAHVRVVTPLELQSQIVAAAHALIESYKEPRAA